MKGSFFRGKNYETDFILMCPWGQCLTYVFFMTPPLFEVYEQYILHLVDYFFPADGQTE